MLKLHSDCTILNKEHIVRSKLQICHFIVWLITSMVGIVIDPHLLQRICATVLFIVKQGIRHMVKVNR